MIPVSRNDRSWEHLAAAFALASVAAWWMQVPQLDWQPARAWAEPWRAFTGAFVHWNLAHLWGNLLGTAAVAALGRAARLPAQAMLAWAVAWPLTQAALLIQPQLVHYGGLSGVLHAGMAVAALWLLARDRGQRRVLGAAIVAGLILKLWLEEPWGPPLRLPGIPGNEGTDMAIAPLAHATGVAAGLLCAAVALALAPRQVEAPDGHR